MCSGSEAGSYLRLTDFVYHSALGLRVIKKKKKDGVPRPRARGPLRRRMEHRGRGVLGSGGGQRRRRSMASGVGSRASGVGCRVQV